TNSSRQIADYILQQYPNDDTRIAAAYAWVTANIEYSKDSMMAINWSLGMNEKVAATLRRRKGVCDNFASLFADLLVKMNIEAVVVNGLAKAGGTTRAHSWTAVKLSNEWFLCDPTWDNGSHFAKQYFMQPPEDFIKAHWPFDPLWQLLPVPVSLQAFERGWLNMPETGIKETVLKAVDSFMALDSLQQLKAQEERMRQIGLDQNHLRNWYAYNNMNIAIIIGEQDMNHYNNAVAAANEANELLNKFAIFRNNAFTPTVADNHLIQMLAPVHKLLKQAAHHVEKVSKGRANFQYDTGELSGKIETLQKRLKTQQDFLYLYLSADTARRLQMFYQ
ncbi:MAG: hypothetical protein EOO03_02845, partial [Chitinophagaceae bacterium]